MSIRLRPEQAANVAVPPTGVRLFADDQGTLQLKGADGTVAPVAGAAGGGPTVIPVDISTADASVTLPADARVDQIVTVKVIGLANHVCTVLAAAGQTIEGGASLTLTIDGEWCVLQFDGEGIWYQVG